MERTQIGTIKASTRSDVIDLSGKTDLLSLAALVRKARLLITVDSAPMHFAAAWGTPQVVLFGPTNPFHWHPRSESAVILLGECDGPVSEFRPPAASRADEPNLDAIGDRCYGFAAVGSGGARAYE